MLVKADAEGLEDAARVLNAGGVVVIPTDTVYGLAAHPSFPEAVERLYTIKGREAKKPIALLAADETAVREFGYEVPETLAKHWPGAPSTPGWVLRADCLSSAPPALWSP